MKPGHSTSSTDKTFRVEIRLMGAADVSSEWPVDPTFAILLFDVAAEGLAQVITHALRIDPEADVRVKDDDGDSVAWTASECKAESPSNMEDGASLPSTH